MAETKITVMMPAFNAGQFIAEAIESVLDQSYSDWELIIVNDGSTDETAEIVDRFADERIRVFHQENRGEAVARNLALHEARGDYIAFLDADDRFTTDHLESTYAFLIQNLEYDAVYTDGFYLNHAGRRTHTLSSQRRGPFAGDLYEAVVRASDVFGPPICTLLSMEVIREHQLRFDSRIVIGPDWDFLTRYAEHGSFGYLNKPTCLYRIHDTNITLRTGSSKRRKSLALCREKVIKADGFKRCSLETRSYVFYDLLINLIYDNPDRQVEVVNWPQFRAMPESEQARLYRLMAAHALVYGIQSEKISDWIWQAVDLFPSDIRNRLAKSLYRLSPSLYRGVLRLRRGWTTPSDGSMQIEFPTKMQ